MESKTAFLRISVAVVILIAPALETHAQVGQSPSSEPLAFDVASIKENKQLADGGSMRLMPDGGVIARHLPARALITIAYDLKTFQLVGAPSWSSDTYFDVNAKTSGGTRAEIFPRLQALLIDRFKLAFHREPREVDGFALVQARPGTL